MDVSLQEREKELAEKDVQVCMNFFVIQNSRILPFECICLVEDTHYGAIRAYCTIKV